MTSLVPGLILLKATLQTFHFIPSLAAAFEI